MNRDRVAAYGNSEYQKEKHRNSTLKRRYDLSLDEYNKLLQEQNKCCAICGTSNEQITKRMHVDHNHDTGKVRGLLCDKCNRGLGFFNDDATQLRKALEYLNENN